MEAPKEILYHFEEMEIHEKAAFDEIIRPADSYTPDGRYWADLPVGERIGFVMKQDGEEMKKEREWLWNMIKEDPLSPISYYFRNFVLPGAGLGLEGYVHPAIGYITNGTNICISTQLRSFLHQ